VDLYHHTVQGLYHHTVWDLNHHTVQDLYHHTVWDLYYRTVHDLYHHTARDLYCDTVQCTALASWAAFLQADVVVWPFVSRFVLAAREMCRLDIRNCCGVHVKAWVDLMAERGTCRETDPDPELFAKALRRERSLDFFDYSTYGVRALHPWLSEGVRLVQLA
jgi:uncharacterized protein with NRDE domain